MAPNGTVSVRGVIEASQEPLTTEEIRAAFADDRTHNAVVELLTRAVSRGDVRVYSDVSRQLTLNVPGLDGETAQMLRQERSRETVREIVRGEKADRLFQRPDGFELLIDAPVTEPTEVHRVEGWLPLEGTATVIGAAKVGKSTLLTELARALADGDSFLGRFPVRPITDGTIAILNLEVSPRTYRRWLQQSDVVHADRIAMLHLRGAAFDVESPAARRWLVDQLRDVHARVVIVDPFSAIYRGQSDVDNREVRGWLDALSGLANDAGVGETVLGVHAGRDKTRSRGASALDDWPDAVWTMTRDGDTRTVTIDGRHDRRAGETTLRFDESAHRLTANPNTESLTAEQRRARDADRKRVETYDRDRLHESRLLSVIEQNPGLTTRALRAVAKSHLSVGTDRANDVVLLCVAGGLVEKTRDGRADAHHLTDKGRARLKSATFTPVEGP